nr:sigma-70 family RNA polymerase sigma factor [Paenibacillus senegalensis]
MQLVKKAQNGDHKAYIELFQTYEPEIYRMAYLYVKNKNDALDVVQEVAYRSYKNLGTLENPQYFKTWLIKITITSALNVLKQKKRMIPMKPEYEPFIGSQEDINIPLSLSLQQLLDALNEEEKSVILLKFYYDYTFNEIAKVLQIPLGTAKSVLYRALQKLRKQTKEAGDL